MLSRKAFHITPSPTLSIDARVKRMKSKGKDIIGFGAGEPDFETPAHIKDAAIKAINENFTRYTSAGGIAELKEAIAEKFIKESGLTYTPEQIVVSNGAKHSLNNTLAALLNDGDEVIIPSPYWVSYPELVKLNGGTPVIIDTKQEYNYKLKGPELEKNLSPRTKALILNSPSNPTGQVYTRNELEVIAYLAVRYNFYIISDEVYEKLIYDGKEHITIASLGEDVRNLTIIVNGVSKTYAMTGWRIGYTASEPELAAAMAGIQSHTTSNPNSIAQKAACAAIKGPQECVEEMRRAFEKRKNFMVDLIKEIPLINCIDAKGAFYLFLNIGETFNKKFRGIPVESGSKFASLLLENYLVALVPGEAFGAPDYVRVSYATSMENITNGLERIASFLRELA